MARRRIALITAVANNGVIGRANTLPWRNPTDLRFFKEKSWARPLIMGRHTHASLGTHLPGRYMIVLSRAADFHPEAAVVAHSLDAAMEEAERWAAANGADEILIAGGGAVYAQAMDRADRIYLTRIHLNPEGDTLFPPLDPDDWRVVEERFVRAGPRDDADMTFMTLDRARP